MKPKTKSTKRTRALKDVEYWMSTIKKSIPGQINSRANVFMARNGQRLNDVVDKMTTTQLRAVVTLVCLGYNAGSHETREYFRQSREENHESN